MKSTSNRPTRSHRPRRGRASGGPRPTPKVEEPPILLGEPSPSLMNINKMNVEELKAKIQSLSEAQAPRAAKIERLLKVPEPPTERIERTRAELLRLQTLERLARERLEKMLG